MKARRHLCAQIPAELHAKVREEQVRMGVKLNQYVELVLTEYFEMKGERSMAATRTMAIQIPAELFARLKAYLSANEISQKQFIISLIERELDKEGSTK